MVSLYPGMVRTEGMIEFAKHDTSFDLNAMESPQFAGRCVAALASDANVVEVTGKILITSEVAEKYGFTDINSTIPKSLKSELWQTSPPVQACG